MSNIEPTLEYFFSPRTTLLSFVYTAYTLNVNKITNYKLLVNIRYILNTRMFRHMCKQYDFLIITFKLL